MCEKPAKYIQAIHLTKIPTPTPSFRLNDWQGKSEELLPLDYWHVAQNIVNAQTNNQNLPLDVQTHS